MVHYRRVVIMALLLSAAGCGKHSPTTPTDAHDVTVSGRVLDFPTNTGVAGATIAFGSIDTGPFVAVATATSNAAGSYTLRVPAVAQSPELRPWYVEVDGLRVGRARLTLAGYRGDLLVHPGTCVARYGIVGDSRALRPIQGATVMLLGATATTGADGWYRIDLGCPANGWVGSNTTFMYVTHARYADGTEMIGRGAYGVERVDTWLQPR